MNKKYFGKYRGVVTNNLDPQQMGRILATVPDVPGIISSTWAMPCVPCNTPTKAGSSLPKVGASVWIEFEQGSLDSPIWSGCFYSSAVVTPVSLKNAK